MFAQFIELSRGLVALGNCTVSGSFGKMDILVEPPFFVFNAGEQVFEIGVARGHEVAGTLEDRWLDSASLSNGKGMTGAGTTKLQTVHRGKGVGIKDDVGVEHAVLIVDIGFDCSKVRGEQGQAIALTQVLKNGAAKGAAFDGIGAGAKFIHQD